ncbi:ammonia-forming cytochrome c nitrite reductase subunit c552 [Fundidesulfovibrio soli]|uniref:ammonia-forming cytochrome c nitrite reductase subunit c552 n=1 Tax=Fundidesulfovibrio soli TaxID=2922716 RepID=UPI001FAEFCDD|nr:ammonia-forming cytochrome c nitrite reductase subunit c552 [Fundidesulfovibrio soli]
MAKNKLLLALLAAAGLSVILVGCGQQAEAPKPPVYKTGLKSEETSNKAFEKLFPAQWLTYQRNNQDDLKQLTDYGGPVPWDKNDTVHQPPKGNPKAGQPYLKNLWLGYPFSFEYKKARGHTYAIQDIENTDRINRYSEQAGLPTTCWNCKTNKMAGWVQEYGDKVWTMEFNSFRQKQDMKDNTIGCPYCHDPADMKLRISSIPLKEAFKKLGVDLTKATRNEMRSYVCAQCHVEYYFQEAKFGAAKMPVFPWTSGATQDKPFAGVDPENMYEYYKDHGIVEDKGMEGWFADWVHPVSKTPMLKAQHPEFENFINGPHGAAGVACADCHMAYTRNVDPDKKKISNHQWTSPLLNIDGTCKQCHQDKTAEYLKSRVLFAQSRVHDQLNKAAEYVIRAHEAVRQANEYKGEKNPNAEALMIQAKENLRHAQWMWDIISAENSMGAHNPVKSLDTLARSQEYARRSADLSQQATNYGISKTLEGDVKTLVPPILEWSRKMQMDPENLKKYTWTTYLKALPKADQVWDGDKKLTAN